MQRLCDFTGSAPVSWHPIDDRVMGGVSRSRMLAGDGAAVFAGTLSLANGGGFCSVRSEPGRFDCGAASGLVVRARGDGKRYRLRLRMDAGLDGVSHEAAFDTLPGHWQEHHLPFHAFLARFRGRAVPDAPPFDPARLATLGLLVGDGQEGPFRLEVAWIATYAQEGTDEPEAGPDPLIPAQKRP